MIIEFNGDKYVAQCGCIKAAALEYVKFQLGMNTRCTDTGVVELELAEGVWLPSAYLFIASNLYKKIS